VGTNTNIGNEALGKISILAFPKKSNPHRFLGEGASGLAMR